MSTSPYLKATSISVRRVVFTQLTRKNRYFHVRSKFKVYSKNSFLSVLETLQIESTDRKQSCMTYIR